jgi:hypothetical protein
MSCSTRAKTLASTFSRSQVSLASAAAAACVRPTAAGPAPAQRLPRLLLAHVRLNLRQPRRVVQPHVEDRWKLSYLYPYILTSTTHPVL